VASNRLRVIRVEAITVTAITVTVHLIRALSSQFTEIVRRDLPGRLTACIGKSAVIGVDSVFPKWRAAVDEDGQYCFAVAL
jgi:hypothetical protein